MRRSKWKVVVALCLVLVVVLRFKTILEKIVCQGKVLPATSTPANRHNPAKRADSALAALPKQLMDIWRFSRLKYRNPELKNYVKPLYGALLADLNRLSRDSEENAGVEAMKLSQEVQRRFHRLQNPNSCEKAKRLVCDINKQCGFGCQLHHVVYCFSLAYGTGRTLVIDANPWTYSNNGWNNVFRSVSDACAFRIPRNMVWFDEDPDESHEVVKAPIFESLDLRRPPLFIPPAVPADLVEHIAVFHRQPSVWWIGQIVRFLLRPSKSMSHQIESLKEKLRFRKPIVGVHVRRTDKVGWEADVHKLDEYMKGVEEYFETLELTQTIKERLVFLATDDIDVWAKAKQRYSNYVFLHNERASVDAKGNRYSLSSLQGIVSDVHLLSQTDYLVCTFSSQVCRLAYELMQSKHADASGKALSLDDMYYFGGQELQYWEAVQSHVPVDRNQLELKIGDLVTIEKTGPAYWFGRNQRTNEKGLFPFMKVREKTKSVNFPTY